MPHFVDHGATVAAQPDLSATDHPLVSRGVGPVEVGNDIKVGQPVALLYQFIIDRVVQRTAQILIAIQRQLHKTGFVGHVHRA